MLIWNTFYGLIPLNRQSYEIERHLCNILIQDESEVAVIARDDQQIASMVFYYTGRNDFQNIYQSPAVMKLSGRDPEMLREVIDSLLDGGRKVYTDCLSMMPLSRAVLIQGKINQQFFSTYVLKEELRIEDTMGIRIIHRITGKNS